jgi:hypothetical protein
VKAEVGNTDCLWEILCEAFLRLRARVQLEDPGLWTTSLFFFFPLFFFTSLPDTTQTHKDTSKQVIQAQHIPLAQRCFWSLLRTNGLDSVVPSRLTKKRAHASRSKATVGREFWAGGKSMKEPGLCNDQELQYKGKMAGLHFAQWCKTVKLSMQVETVKTYPNSYGSI